MSVKRTYKDTIFRNLFGAEENKQNALDLYNALTGKSYTNLSDVEFNTLDDVIYMSFKNDVSLIIDDDMMLWEHQSTTNPNMPLRGLMYFAKLYQTIVETQQRSVYSSSVISLPTPHFYVFYAGEDDRPEKETLKLSDAFVNGAGDLEVVATVLNINAGKNEAIMKQCAALSGYSELLARIRYNRDNLGLTIEQALKTAIDECIQIGVLRDYLSKQKAEVTEMFLTEYDEAKTKEQLAMEHEAIGEARGILKALINLVREDLLSPTVAAEQLGMTLEQFQAQL